MNPKENEERNRCYLKWLEREGVPEEESLSRIWSNPDRGYEILALRAFGLPKSIADYFWNNNLFKTSFIIVDADNQDEYYFSGEEFLNIGSVYGITLMEIIRRHSRRFNQGVDIDVFFESIGEAIQKKADIYKFVNIYNRRSKPIE